jgi:hypothetical protein
MKNPRSLTIVLILIATGIASAANVPPGLTGLWRFQNSTDKLKATVGTDLTTSHPDNSFFFLGPWTDIGVDSWHTKYSDGGIVQDRSFDFLTAFHGIGAEGKGTGVYINKYTIAVDFFGGEGWNSLYQTAFNGNANDGDLWINATNAGAATIGVGDLGYSASTFIATNWHRIVWSVDNGHFFRVYVDGTLVLDGVGQPVDGRFSLELDRFNLFADNNWEDAWCLVGTVAVWNRPLTGDEVAALGGWIGGAATPTPLIFSETTTNSVPIIAAVSPADGETNAAPKFSYQASIVDSSTATVDQSSIQLRLDGEPVTPIVTGDLGVLNVRYSAGGLLRSGSTHKYTLTFNTTGVVSSITNESTFTVQNYTSYEWRFTSGDLGTSLGDAVMSYTDGATPGLTSFGTTDGSTVPHVGGAPAKYMHVPAFSDDLNGYHITLNATGPNAGTNAYVNRYSAIFDVLIPSPIASSDWLPFFNTDPFNLNDADFYFAGDGSIGIGGGGYSAANTILANTWYRIVFVADLEGNALTYYVNGTNVKSRSGGGVGGRWAMYSNQDPGPDLLLFNEGDTSGVYTHELYLSSFAFTDRVLSASEAAALGGPSANGILVPSFTTAPAMTIQQSGGSATISWPAPYVGYALEQTDNLVAPQWKPVAGVTNNSVTVSATGVNKFFRLVQ